MAEAIVSREAAVELRLEVGREEQRVSDADHAEGAGDRGAPRVGVRRRLDDREHAPRGVGAGNVSGLLEGGDGPLDRLAERRQVDVVAQRGQLPRGDRHERCAGARAHRRAGGEEQQRGEQRGGAASHAA